MDDAVTIRSATEADLDALIAMLANDPLGQTREQTDAGSLARYRTAFADIAADPRNDILVAERQGAVIGCLQLTFIPGLSYTGGERAQIEAVRVAADARGHGLGRRLVEHAIAAARARGAVLVQLTSDKSRPDALAFYEQLGFTASHEGFKLRL